jgi:hypothetical protein
MITAVVVAVLLSSHGEAPREVKFQGALLSQAEFGLPALPAVTTSSSVNLSELERQLASEIAARPSMVAGIVVLSVGGGLAVVGILGTYLGAAVGGLGLAALGIIVAVVGIVVALVGAAVMIGQGIGQRVSDRKIAALRKQIEEAKGAQPPSPPPSFPSVMSPFEGGIRLAAF